MRFTRKGFVSFLISLGLLSSGRAAPIAQKLFSYLKNTESSR